ncbi:MAG: pyruvate kinase, partial [Acidimicrobiia bacterium]
MPRRTKIVASIGPACEDPSTLAAMVEAGMDVARLSLAHGPLEETLDRLARIRAVDPTLGVLADLPGPKIRAGLFPEGGVHLADGATVDLVPGTDGEGSTEHRVVVDHPGLLADVAPGDRVRLGDGALQLQVRDVDDERAKAEVTVGGWARGRPGVALPAGRLSMSSPTPNDLRLLDALASAGVDVVAISFVRTAADV